jgi:hypothetical protein
MNTSDTAGSGPLTMVDAAGARGDQASDILRDGAIFDALILLQSKGTFYKVIAEHK